MIKNAEQKQAELEDLNEVMGAAFKIKNDPLKSIPDPVKWQKETRSDW
jgi:hypothetical protein